MACGTPVITSNVSSLPEFASEAALLTDPHNIDEIAQAIMRLLEDEQLQTRLREKGYQRAKQYTWERSAQKMLHVYEQLHAGKGEYPYEEIAP
jgi:glycosyltransferase involved in cell wall biosynthesis